MRKIWGCHSFTKSKVESHRPKVGWRISVAYAEGTRDLIDRDKVLEVVEGLVKVEIRSLRAQGQMILPPIYFVSYEDLVQAICQCHQRPIPRFDAIAILDKILKQQNHPTDFLVSGMDSSDGLADAIAQICRASKVGAKIHWRSLPIHSAVRTLAGDHALDWVLYGGEDFELVLCMPLSLAEKFVNQLSGAVIIGEIIDGDRIDGLEMRSAFQHFEP